MIRIRAFHFFFLDPGESDNDIYEGVHPKD